MKQNIRKFLLFLFYFPLIIKSYYIKPDFLELRKTEEVVDTTYGKCKVVVCGSTYCSSENGRCAKDEETNEDYCECEKGYTTVTQDSFYKCCYKQKSLMTAFFLEVFIGFGVGHFYAGNKAKGIIKLIVYLILLISILIICFYRMKKTENERENSFIFRFMKSICFLVCGFTYLGWQMIDSILFTLDEFKDQNGMSLYY